MGPLRSHLPRSTMGKEFYVRVGSSVSGPFTSQELRDVVSTGSLQPHHEVSVDQTKWYGAAHVKGLSFLSSTRPPLGAATPIEQKAAGAKAMPAPRQPPQQLPAIKTDSARQSRRDEEPRRSDPHSTSHRRLLLLVGGVVTLLLVCGFAWVLFGPDSSLGLFLGTPINVKGWYTTDRLSSSTPFGPAIELTKEGRNAGMQFLVVEFIIPVAALDARKLSPTELEELHKKNEAARRVQTSDPASKEPPYEGEWWTYELSHLHMKLHTPDGRTNTASSIELFGVYSPAGGKYTGTEPNDRDTTVVFLVRKELLEEGTLVFQYKDYPRVPLTSGLMRKSK